MPLVATALTFGSFGDILEAAKIAKRIVDVLRNGGSNLEARRRQKLISTLEGMCDDMAKLTLVFDEGSFTDRLWAEVALCRSLLAELYAKINSYASAGFRGLLDRTWMVVVEPQELASWRAQISERRAALQDLLSSFNSIQLHELGERLGRVGSQVQFTGSRVDSVGAQVQNVGDQVARVGSQVQDIGIRLDSVEAQVQNVGTLGVFVASYLSTVRASEIRGTISEICGTSTALQPKMGPMSLHDVSDPVFFVVDPLGRRITVQLSLCNNFHDLDRILKAYLFNHPDAGSEYVNRGDYNIISVEGQVIPRSNLRGEVGTWMQFDMSIIKRRKGQATQQSCPQCGRTSAEAVEGSWVN
ncbi:hypothetical protein B0H13DRAFT_2668264 [Mycena leptocephala]|nr:hypothetical protein B0H13DRAFT_2668264 [Mycena leptocephala]